MNSIDFTNYLSRTTVWKENACAEELRAILLEFPFNNVTWNHGINVMQFRIELNGTESEKQIKALLNQKNKYAVILNKDNVTVYREKRDIVIEFPSSAGNVVRLGDVYSEEFREMTGLPIIIGMDAMKNKIYYDLSKAPHMLVAGTTGSGKSIFMHAIIDSLIMHDPHTDIFMIDPKMTEYNVYDALKHFHLVKDVDSAIDLLEFMSDLEMEARYKEFDKAGVRDIDEAIAKGIEMRRVVIMVDEFADLILTSKRKVENAVVRLAQKARACGIHLVLATQRPTADVVTGLIKSNIPTRVCMKVNSSLDSRIILDRNGGETITEKGEMLLLRNGDFEPVRVQGCFMNSTERESIVALTMRSDNTLIDQEWLAKLKNKQG